MEEKRIIDKRLKLRWQWRFKDWDEDVRIKD